MGNGPADRRCANFKAATTEPPRREGAFPSALPRFSIWAPHQDDGSNVAVRETSSSTVTSQIGFDPQAGSLQPAKAQPGLGDRGQHDGRSAVEDRCAGRPQSMPAGALGVLPHRFPPFKTETVWLSDTL